jgi:tetratricopeptide (TPR) repeat protein
MATDTGDDKKKRIAALSWKRGSEAMGKEQWDFAIEMFGQAVGLVPDNLMYRQTLRGVEYRKYNNNKTGKRMAGMTLMKIRAQIKKARSKKDWDAVDKAVEEGLALNPWDPQLNADLGEACKERGYDEVATFAYEKAVLAEPENKGYNRELAILQELRGNFGEAIKAWERIRKADPLNGEARSKITQLGASSVMQAGGYEGAARTTDVRSRSAYDEDHEARSKKTMPGAADGPGESKEADLERAIRKDPDNKDNYTKLGDFYKREGKLEQAVAMFEKALEVSGGDPNIREQLEDVQLDVMRQQLEGAKDAALKGGGDEAAKKRYDKLRSEFHQREIEVLAARIERYPADMRIRFELAQRYMMFKKYQLAIPLLQRAVTDSRLKCDVLVSLGKCFIAEKKNAMARRQLEKALPEIDQVEEPGLFKETHYLMGRLCQQAGDKDAAENHYSEVLAVDYEYKDALQRLEKLQSGGGDAETE